MKYGSTDQSITLQIFNTDGTPMTDATSASGISMKYQRQGGALTTITVSDLASTGAAHSDGGLIHTIGQSYRFDVPDVFGTGADWVEFSGSIVGGVILPVRVQMTEIDHTAGLPQSGLIHLELDTRMEGVDVIDGINDGFPVTDAYALYIYSYNAKGELEDLDSTPSVSVVDYSGTDLSAFLQTVTKSPSTTGIYYVDFRVYTSYWKALAFIVTATRGGVATQHVKMSQVVRSGRFTHDDRLKLEAAHGKLPSSSYLLGTASSNGSGYATPANVTAAQAAIIAQGDAEWATGDISGLATAASVAALNDISTADIDARLAAYDGPTKTEMDAAFTEIKGATFSSVTDTLEAIRDRGDAAWTAANVSALASQASVDALNDLSTADIDARLAAYDGPTKAELDIAIANLQSYGDAEWVTADTSALATAASVAALNDISTADVDARLAAYDGPTKAELDAAFTEIKGATFDTLTDSLEAIRDRGDAAWTGGSSLTATDVWTHEDRTLSSGANLNDLSTADIDARLAAYDGPTHAELVAAFTEIKGGTWSSLTDTLEALRDRGDSAWVTADVSALASQASITALNDLSTADIDARLAAYDAPTKAELDAAQAAIIAQGDAAWATADVSALATAASIAALNNLSTADIDARLAAYDGPTHAEIVAAFTEIKGATWNSATDSLESIRDRGDEAWATAVGVTEAEVWSYFTGIDGDVARTAIAVAVDARLKQTTQHAS